METHVIFRSRAIENSGGHSDGQFCVLRSDAGVTLIELLVVIVIIALIQIALLLPAVQAASKLSGASPSAQNN